MKRTCFNCEKIYSLHGYSGAHCPDSDKCDRCSLWEPIHDCDTCAFRKYRVKGNIFDECLFKKDTSAKSFTMDGKLYYDASNKYPTKNNDEAEHYCSRQNNYWAWKLDPSTL